MIKADGEIHHSGGVVAGRALFGGSVAAVAGKRCLRVGRWRSADVGFLYRGFSHCSSIALHGTRVVIQGLNTGPGQDSDRERQVSGR